MSDIGILLTSQRNGQGCQLYRSRCTRHHRRSRIAFSKVQTRHDSTAERQRGFPFQEFPNTGSSGSVTLSQQYSVLALLVDDFKQSLYSSFPQVFAPFYIPYRDHVPTVISSFTRDVDARSRSQAFEHHGQRAQGLQEGQKRCPKDLQGLRCRRLLRHREARRRSSVSRSSPCHPNYRANDPI